MTETIGVRAATQQDLDILLGFEQGIIGAERPFDPTLKPDPISYYDLKAMIDAPDVEVVVAECEGRIVGSGYARIETSKTYLQHERHAYLGFMFVVEDFRGRGINMLVLKRLQEWALSKGIREFRLDVYADNGPAIKAYEKAGFKKHLTEMRMGIGE